jgi:hypothetical protein
MSTKYSKKILGYITVGLSSLTVMMASQMSQAQAVQLNLTTQGSSGYVNNAFFQQISNNEAAGTGVIKSFVRLDSNNSTEQGYNTDYRSVQFDEKSDSNFTRSLLLKDVPIVKISGIDYRQFILDINEPNSGNKSKLTLDKLQIFLGNANNLTGYSANSNTTNFNGKATKIFDLDTNSEDSSVLLKDLNQGSGRYDLLTYIPNAVFTGSNPYVYLYSKFTGNDGGFEEWAVRTPHYVAAPPGATRVPEPSTTAALGLLAVGAVKVLKKKRLVEV